MSQQSLKETTAGNKPAASTVSSKATQREVEGEEVRPPVTDKPTTSTASTKAAQPEFKGKEIPLVADKDKPEPSTSGTKAAQAEVRRKEVRPVADKPVTSTAGAKSARPEAKGKVQPALVDTRRAENRNCAANAKAKGPRKALSLRENGPNVALPLREIVNAVPNPKAVTHKGLATKSKLPRPVVAKQPRQSLVGPNPAAERQSLVASNPAAEGSPNDPFSCKEYASDIYRYLCELDQRPCYTIAPGFMENQRKILPGHRTTLVDWLVQVQRKFRLLPETLYLAIDVLDRYLQVEQVQKSTLQLVGVTCFLIAAKYEEIYPPQVVDFAIICADTYTTQSIIKKEREILNKLAYNLNKPVPLHFLRQISTLSSATQQMHNLAKYILELSLLDSDLSSHRPSIKAAAAFQLSDQIINGSLRWSALLRGVTGNTSRELIATRTRLRLCLTQYHNTEKYTSITTKYSGQAGDFIALLPSLMQEDTRNSIRGTL